MKIFDMHCDMGTNLYERHLKGEDDVLSRCHLKNMEKGEVKGVFCACFFDGHEDWSYMKEMIKHSNKVLDEEKSIRKITNKEELIDDDKTLVCISVEGMCGVDGDVEKKIEWLYNNNVRIASLCWNDSNALAAGWPNNPLKGLSELGYRAIKRMNELKMIIDVSHINEKGFWDIISSSSKPVIATHSNSRKLCPHDRNLTNQQIKAIGAKGGLVGLNACGDFIDVDDEKQTSLNLAKHARYMADLIGVKHIACGFDYMDFLGENYDDSMALDLSDASYSQNLIKSFKEVGFNDDEIKDIAFYNVYNFLKEQL